jgi:hypothetical protein
MIELLENSELGALAPSRLGNSFIGDEQYSNYVDWVEKNVNATKLPLLASLHSQYDSKISEAEKNKDCATLNWIFTLLDKQRPYRDPTWWWEPQDYLGKRDAYNEFLTPLIAKKDSCIADFNKTWSIDSAKKNDCDYLVQRANDLSKIVGNFADVETKNAISEGKISKLSKGVFDTYTQAIKDAKCEDYFKKKDDATDLIKDILAKRKSDKDKEDADAKAKADELQNALTQKTQIVTSSTLTSSNHPTTNNTKLYLGIGVAVLIGILIIKK